MIVFQNLEMLKYQSNLTFGIFIEQRALPIITAVKLVCKDLPLDPNIVAVVDKRPLLTGGRCSEVDLWYKN